MRKITVAALAACLALTLGARAEIDLKNFDLSVKPQDDFFRYANGAWIKEHPIPADQSRWGSFNILDDNNQTNLHAIVDRVAAKKDGATPIEKMVGDFYASGMDEAAINAAGVKPLQPELDRLAAIKLTADVLKAIAHLQTFGVGAGFGFGSSPDQKNSDMEIASLRQGGLGLPERGYYFNDDEKSQKIRQQYVAHMINMLALIGEPRESATVSAAAVMTIETKLALASFARVQLRDPYRSYHKMKLSEAVAKTPGIDFKSFFAERGAPAFDEVNLAHPDFFKAFEVVLNSTPVSDWQAYLRWHLVRYAAPCLGEEIVKENFAFNGVILSGVTEQKPRWKRVIAVVDGQIGEALGQLYVAEYFPPEAKARMAKLVEDLRASLHDRINALEWMDAPTKAKAQEKLAAFGVKIGYPDKWRDYSAVKIARDDYLGNVMRSDAFEVSRRLARIGQAVDRSEWGMTPPTVNAYYRPTNNEIVFPAGILQPPFFDFKADDAVNYGGIGVVIGHEMTHGFDDSGAKYDAHGNLNNWWSDDSQKKFKERTNAVVKQFDGYETLPGVHLKGELTQGENVADLGGLKISYYALQKALADKPRDPINGFTPEQRFFLSHAAVWREGMRDEERRRRANIDPHSPGEFRVNGPLSNLDEFAKAFNLTDTSPMRRPPETRVTIVSKVARSSLSAAQSKEPAFFLRLISTNPKPSPVIDRRYFSRMNSRFLAAVAATTFTVLAARADIDLKNFDPSVKPSDNFFAYANGGWQKANPIPAAYSTWGAFNEVDEHNKVALHRILEKAATVEKPGSAEELVGGFYASGMDETAANIAGIAPLQVDLTHFAGIASISDVQAAMAILHHYKIRAGFIFASEPDPKDSRMVIAGLGQAGLGLPDRDYYFRDDEKSKKLREQYVAHIAKIFELAGDKPDAASTAAAAVMKLETALAKGSKTNVELRDPVANYHKMTIPELAKLTPHFDWKAYFAAVGVKVPDFVDVGQPEFFAALDAEMANTPIADWQSYFRWQLIHGAAPYLSTNFVNENFAFYGTALTGAKELRDRWKRVLDTVDRGTGEALGQLYVATEFPPESKRRMLALVDNLKAALRDDIKSLTWMDEPTKVKALEKLEAFGVKVGYPDKWIDYSTLKADRHSYVTNVFHAADFNFRRDMAKIGKPVDPTDWGMSPPTVNAYYDPQRNEIVFPAGILQGPFFSKDADDAVNYGGIGAVIGHEMTHGFDDQGSQFDAVGNLSNWWTEESAKRFKERTTAIVKQFSGYTAIDDLHINGELTQGENIADLGGLKIAYAAFKKATAGKPQEKIDGFTPDQRFFLSWATVWHTNQRDAQVRLQVNTDPHSPAQFRVNGPVSNLDEFYAAFGVPEDAPMRRALKDRVQIW